MIKYNKLNKTIENNLFTDLTLILEDNQEKITLEVHRVVLFASCDYFEKMLTNCQEKNANTITMQVANASIMRDIIMSFYGKTNDGNCRYQLEKNKCLDFLGIEIDLTYFENNVVPKEDFDLLLDVLDIIGYSENTIRILAKNIPEEYDLSLLPRELLREILVRETNRSFRVACKNSSFFQFWNYDPIHSVDLVPIKMFQIGFNTDFNLISRGEKFIWILTNGHVTIYNVDTDNVVKKKLENVYYNINGLSGSFFDKKAKIIFSSDDKIIASYNSHKNMFAFWDFDSGEMIKIIYEKERIVSLYFIENNQYLISYHENGVKNTWNLENGNLESTEKISEILIHKIVCSPDYKKMAILSKELRILDFNTHELLYTIPEKSHDVMFSPDSQKIVYNTDKSIYMHDANNGNEIFHVSPDNYDHKSKFKFSTDSQIFIVYFDKYIYIYDANSGNMLNKKDIVNLKDVAIINNYTALAKKILNILA